MAYDMSCSALKLCTRCKVFSQQLHVLAVTACPVQAPPVKRCMRCSSTAPPEPTSSTRCGLQLVTNNLLQ
jgi:hypothetical protein